MKNFILSDTHDRMSKINELRQRIFNYNPDILIHLGDFVSPFFIYQIFKDIKTSCNIDKIILIKGNNDGDIQLIRSTCDKIGACFYNEYFMEKLDGKNIFAIHKPDLAENLAKSGDFDYILYGHTHKREYKKIGDTKLINPGTASGYLSEEATYLTFDVNNDEINFQII